ncbi:MAG: hypothetical protein JWP34_5318 [Massilia sp.]|nr:hypothetical protein [Massilia sp.]
MRIIPEDDARALVRNPLTCEDVGDWATLKVQPGTVVIGVGVLDENGVSVRMYVELVYRPSYKTKITRYLFTLFQRFPYGNERIYQLEVTQTPKLVRDMHKLSHEHMGSLRTTGDASWATWGYDEVLAHFCAQTNITFAPSPVHPETFELRANK